MPASTTCTRLLNGSALKGHRPRARASAVMLAGLLFLVFGQGRAVAAEWSTPQRIATQPPLEDPARLSGVSCPSDSFCAASDTFGNVLIATDPMGGATSWALTSAKPGRTRPAQVSASTLEQSCAQAGTAGPRVIESLLRHPGDKKTQGASLEADWPAMPEECEGSYVRVAMVTFEIQDPFNLRRWIRMGGWAAPIRDDLDAQREIEEEKEAEGKSCYREGPAGRESICRFTNHLTNNGGEASASSEETRAKEYPFHVVEKQQYRCAPGQGVTHVRGLIRNRVIDSETKRVVAEALKRVGVEVVRASYVTGEPKRRGRVRGPC